VSSPPSPIISRQERPANNLVGNPHVEFLFAVHTSNCLVFHLSRSSSGANVNDLFLLALRARNSHNDVGWFSRTGHGHLRAADSTTHGTGAGIFRGSGGGDAGKHSEFASRTSAPIDVTATVGVTDAAKKSNEVDAAS
jgi:hypothetical protein